MVTISNVNEWAKWNDHIFREEKKAAVFAVEECPMRDDIAPVLDKKLNGIPLIVMAPEAYEEIFQGSDEYMEPAALLFFSGGHCVGRNSCMLFEGEDMAWNRFLAGTLVKTFLEDEGAKEKEDS